MVIKTMSGIREWMTSNVQCDELCNGWPNGQMNTLHAEPCAADFDQNTRKHLPTYNTNKTANNQSTETKQAEMKLLNPGHLHNSWVNTGMLRETANLLW